MNSEIINLLKNTASNFAQLAEAFEQEQKAINARFDHAERDACETRQALKEAANMILSKL
jgi:hypothetical protein